MIFNLKLGKTSNLLQNSELILTSNKTPWMKKFLLLIITLFISLFSFAQERTLSVVDKDNGESIPFANVCFEDLKSGKKEYTTTDANGIAHFESGSEVELSVSFMGYKAYIEKVHINKNLTVSLAPDVFALDQVVVTGQNKPMVRDSSIYEISVFDSKLIQERGAVNLGDVLRVQPTIKIAQSGPTGANINILGLGGENVKIMIDGVPIIGRIDGNLDLNQITMENVDHIEVIEGPMSVIYGSNALAGTVNIITKSNKWNKFKFNANTYVESPATFNVDVLGTGKFGDNVITGTLARNYFGGITEDDSRKSKWRSSTQYNSDLNYARYGERYTFRMNGKYFSESMWDRGAVEQNKYANDLNYLTDRISGNAFLDFNHNNDMQTNVQASVSHYNRKLHQVRKDLTTLDESILGGDTTTFLNLMTRATFNHKISERVSYQTGLDANHEIGTAKRLQGGQQDIGDYAVFITGKHEIWKGVVVQPGFRYAYNTKFTSPLLYSINVKTDISDGWQSRASFAKGFRAPSLKELYLDYPHGGFDVVGNPNLGPESSYTLNGSLAYTFRNEDKYLLKFEGKGYFNSIYDMIVFSKSPDSTPDREIWTNVNRDHIESFGWIINANYDLGRLWSFNTSFTRGAISSIEYIEQGTGGKYFYSNNFLASVVYRVPKVDFTTRVEYAYNGPEASRSVDEITLKESYIEAYHDINLTVTKSFWDRRFNLSAGVKNLLDNQDLEYVNGTETKDRLLSWGRSYFFKLNYQLTRN